MKPLTSCCCFDLRTGGLIIGWLSIIYCIFNILRVFVFDSMSALIPIEDLAVNGAWVVGFVSLLVAEVLWIVGIHKNKERMMKPSLILSIVGCVLMGITYAIIVIMSFVGFVATSLSSNQRTETEVNLVIKVAPISSVIDALLAVLITYFVIVKYYVYKEIKERNKQPIDLNSAGETDLGYNMFFNHPNLNQIQTDTNNTHSKIILTKNESDIVFN